MGFLTAVAIAVTVFFWASAFVGIRVGLTDYSPGALALLRYLVASIAIIPVYLWRTNYKRIPLSDWPKFIAVGLTGFTLYNIALNHGEVSVPAGIASFMIGLIPLFTVLFSVIFLKDPFTYKAWLGVSVSFLGVLLIAFGEHAGVSFDWGVIFTLVAALCGSIYTVSQKPLLKKYSALQVGAVGIWVGTFFLCIYSPDLYHQVQAASPKATISAVYMGIFPGAIAYTSWSYALSKVNASRAAIYLYSLPLVTTLIGWLYLSELPALFSLLGGFIALLGAFIVSRYNKP